MLTEKLKKEIYVSIMEGMFKAAHPELKESGMKKLNESENAR